MAGWHTRSDRIDALERELGATREALRAAETRLAEAQDALRDTLGRLEDRLEREAQARGQALDALAERNDRDGARVRDEVAALAAAVASHGEEARPLRVELTELAGRIAAQEGRHHRLVEALARLEAPADPEATDEEEDVVAAIRTRLARLDLKLDLQEEAARAETLALLDRIETARGPKAA